MADLFGNEDEPAAAKPKAPTRYVVPSGSRYSVCRGEDCGVPVYWVPGIPCPISCDTLDGEHPDSQRTEDHQPVLHDGHGYSHFLNCPNADTFSKSSRKRVKP